MPRHPTVVWCWNLRRVPTTTCAPETTTSQIAAKREDFLSKPQIQPAVNASSHGLELCCDLTSQFLYHEVYMLPSYSIVGRVFLLEFTWFSITYITYVWFSISFIFLVNLNSAVGIVFLINNYLLKYVQTKNVSLLMQTVDHLSRLNLIVIIQLSKLFSYIIVLLVTKYTANKVVIVIVNVDFGILDLNVVRIQTIILKSGLEIHGVQYLAIAFWLLFCSLLSNM